MKRPWKRTTITGERVEPGHVITADDGRRYKVISIDGPDGSGARSAFLRRNDGTVTSFPLLAGHEYVLWVPRPPRRRVTIGRRELAKALAEVGLSGIDMTYEQTAELLFKHLQEGDTD